MGAQILQVLTSSVTPRLEARQSGYFRNLLVLHNVGREGRSEAWRKATPARPATARTSVVLPHQGAYTAPVHLSTCPSIQPSIHLSIYTALVHLSSPKESLQVAGGIPDAWKKATPARPATARTRVVLPRLSIYSPPSKSLHPLQNLPAHLFIPFKIPRTLR